MSSTIRSSHAVSFVVRLGAPLPRGIMGSFAGRAAVLPASLRSETLSKPRTGLGLGQLQVEDSPPRPAPPPLGWSQAIYLLGELGPGIMR